jgi:hypothetical protein
LPEPTLAQRLVRAKAKIRQAGIPYEIPKREAIAERLEAVQSVLYLIFNEGYSATVGESLVRTDLCAEAIRLARVLCGLMPEEPEASGLLALMLLQDSRRLARTDAQGDLVTLEEQTRLALGCGGDRGGFGTGRRRAEAEAAGRLSTSGRDCGGCTRRRNGRIKPIGRRLRRFTGNCCGSIPRRSSP